MSKILLVEDEKGVRELVLGELSKVGHLVDTVADGEHALAVLRTNEYDLVVLDLTLPGCDGIEICRCYRARGGEAPILMLTARSTVDSRACGLDSGADDYLTKPFHLVEFAARVRALLRRSCQARTEQITAGELELDLRTRRARWRGEELSLVNKEFDILSFLVRHEGEAYSAEQILARVWPSDTEVQEATVRSHIKHIRSKTGASAREPVIRHLRGLGYFFERL